MAAAAGGATRWDEAVAARVRGSLGCAGVSGGSGKGRARLRARRRGLRRSGARGDDWWPENLLAFLLLLLLFRLQRLGLGLGPFP